jgi:hypothetical protein
MNRRYSQIDRWLISRLPTNVRVDFDYTILYYTILYYTIIIMASQN